MELIVGQNSYVTTKEASTIMKNYFLEDSDALTQFDELSNNDKSVLLYRSCLDMQKLPYRGFKKEKGQRLSFPRINKFGYESDEEMVKLAQVLNAVSFMKSDYTSEMNQQIQQLVNNGVNSFRLGSFSININDKIVASRMGTAGMSNSGMVETVLSDWLQGGFRIV
jgi:hypothetical protein